jgi:putative heme iron utilization protein
MSTHTQDLVKDSRCSLTVASKEFKGAQDGRANLIGECARITDKEEIAKAQEIYLKKHPGAFWVSYGDFQWYRMTVENVRTVGGFARAGFLKGEEYEAGRPDPISAIQERVAGHMNKDHMDATIQMVKHYVGIDVEEALMSSMDSKGMYIKVARTPVGGTEQQNGKIRLPWARPVEDPKGIKAMIMEMTNAASKGSEPEAAEEA